MLRSRLLSLALIFAPALASGHNDVSETIKALTAEIKNKPTADLYYQRATEFRALKEKAHAIEDLESALQLEPENRRALVALIQLLGPTPVGLKRIKEYEGIARTKEEKFEAGYLLAFHHTKLQTFEVALSHCEALQKTRPNDDPALDLLHAKILLELNRPEDATIILKNSWNRTESIVLRNNWIDAALTAGQTETVLPIIQEELASSRFRSSWLIRRARAFLILKKNEAAQSDLREALNEIAHRINPERPDYTLIADRGLIHALMGNKNPAKRDLETLEKAGYAPDAFRLLRDTLAIN
ncbi:hypothetical protein OAE39_00280 [Akkermansiaceae bacterium]|nr:hypothetical protein [Akkermansiaceae bacterium]